MDALPAPELPDWILRQLPSGITRSRIDVGGLRMHVMEAGQGTPVLAVHGNPAWSFLYRKVAAAQVPEAVAAAVASVARRAPG